MAREPGEVWTGDLIEFPSQHEESGIITNMMDDAGNDIAVCRREDQRRVKAMVIQRATDGRFAVWQTANLPRGFVITEARRAN